MLTLKSILKEIKNVPANRLEEIYQFVNSLNVKSNQSEASRNKILSFGGAFKDMTSKEYSSYVKQTKKIRTKLLERTIEL